MIQLNTFPPTGFSRPSGSALEPVNVLVQVTRCTDEGFCGVALPLCCNIEPFAFRNFPQLTTLLSILCDRLGRPEQEEALNLPVDGNSQLPKFVPAKPEFGLKLGHFTVEILHRRNQTLQGRLIVPNRGEVSAGRKPFRSDKELLNLMQNYMA